MRITLERMRVEHAALEQSITELHSKSGSNGTPEQEGSGKVAQEPPSNSPKKKITEQLTQATEQFEKRKAAYQQFGAQANQLSSELASIAQKDSLVHN